MQKKPAKKLTLNRETVRQLDDRDLAEVAGGLTSIALCSVLLCSVLDPCAPA